jgi:MFS family permease
LTKRLGGPARRRVVVFLAMVLALNSADSGAVGGVSAQLEPALHIGTAQIGLLVTVSSLVGALSALPFGILADKTNRVRLLSVAIVLWGIGEVVSGFSTSFGMLLLTRLALGGVIGIAAPAVASLTGDYFPAAERGRIYGYVTAGEIVGAGLGIGVASLVSSVLGWRAAFIILAVPSIALARALWRDLPEPARGGQSHLEPGSLDIPARGGTASGPSASAASENAPRDDAVQRKVRERGVEAEEGVIADPSTMTTPQVIRYVLRVRTNVLIIVASSLGYLFLAGLRTFGVIFAAGHFDVSQGVATLLLGVIGTGALLGLLTSGRLADLLIRRGYVNARIVVAAVAFVLAAVLLLVGLLYSGFIVSLALLILAAGAVAAPNPPLDAAQLDVMPSQLWGRAQGVRTALRSGLEALGPLIFGLIAGLFVSGNTLGSSASHVAILAQARGLEVAFILMLVPLGGAGILLFARRRYYAVDVAAADLSERRGKEHIAGTA